MTAKSLKCGATLCAAGIAALAANAQAPCAAMDAQSVYNIRDFGASETNTAAQNAAAIQRAIDAAGNAGNGMARSRRAEDTQDACRTRFTVVVPPGTFHTGTIRLRSHVELHLERGAVLKASVRPEDYNANDAFPENFHSENEEWSGGHLILGYKVEDVAITGEGTIDGSGLSFFGECDEDSRFPFYKYGLRLHPLDRAWFRPGPLVAFFLSKDVRLEGVNIVDSPAWTTHFRCCEGVAIRGVSIRNDRTVANSDGFSIDCSRNVTVSGCTVVTGDDAVAIRASCKLHAAEHPCENVVVEDCDLSSCAMGVRIGIGSGTIRDVAIRRCRIMEAANGIRFHPEWVASRKGCYIERVHVEDCDIDQCDHPVNSLPGTNDWRIRDILFERCRFASLQPSSFFGDAAHHPENVVFRDCSRVHLDRLRVRHHRGYGGERSREFLQIDGEADVRTETHKRGGDMTGDQGDVLARFYDGNEGKALRRLPSWIVPENAFCGFGIDDPSNALQRRVLRLFLERSDWNVLTWCCRTAEHGHPEVAPRLAEAARMLEGSGIELLMELDPRLMRNAFLAEHPDDFLRQRQFGHFRPDASGAVRFEVRQDYMCDYAGTGGMNDPYSGWKPGRLVAVRAVRGQSPRPVEADAVTCSADAVSGVVRGLAGDETLQVEVEWPLKEADPCSPNLQAFSRKMALRYRELGVSGAMRDEYGFQKPNTKNGERHQSFWFSPRFAALYARRSGGRSLEADLPLLALGADTPENHVAAIAYSLSVYDACKASEEDFYAMNKEYFGPDVYVAKHVTWHFPFDYDEILHNGIVWWAARRDWAQSDELNPVPVSTGMMKKFGTPLWLNEGYGPNPEHYMKTLWQYVVCGGRMVYHGIYCGDPSMTSVAKYADPAERAYHRHADLLGDDAVRAEEIVRLLPLVTRAPIDCPVAHVFGHERLVDWLDPAFKDWGEPIAHGLGGMGFYVDAYPASELQSGTFQIDGDGYLRVGRQRYLACVLWHLSSGERKAWDGFAAGRTLKTRLFIDPGVGEVADFLASSGAARQTPLGPTGLGGATRHRLPPADGLLRLTDGTVARVKGGLPDFAGDAISGELETGGVRVAYAARGLFAARAENGELSAVCGGGVTCVEGGGLSLQLDAPVDLALVKINGEWRGVWQTPDTDAPVPQPLRRITRRWTKLRAVKSLPK